MSDYFVGRLFRKFLWLVVGFALLGSAWFFRTTSGVLTLLCLGLGVYILAHEGNEFRQLVQLGRLGSHSAVYTARITRELSGRPLSDACAAIMAAVCVHFARLDGHISRPEIDAIRSAIDRDFAESADHALNARVVKLTQTHLASIGPSRIPRSMIELTDYFHRLLRKGTHRQAREQTFEFLFVMIYETILADGPSAAEEDAFASVARYHGIRGETLANLRRTAAFNVHARGGSSAGSSAGARAGNRTHRTRSERTRAPRSHAASKTERQNDLDLFDLGANFTRARLERAWKKIAMRHHPDRHHRAAPQIYNAANERFLRYKAAHERLKARSR